MTLQTIANKLKPIEWIGIDFDKNLKSKIRNGNNTRIDALISFLELTEYKLSVDGIKCSNVDDIRSILQSKPINTYKTKLHITQYNSFIKGETTIYTQTLLDWCEVLELVPTLEKS